MAAEWIPRLAAIDLRNLQLTPHEAFVLSRVDGRSTCAEIAAVSGLSPDEAHALLAVLRTKGALVSDEADAPAHDAPIADDEPVSERTCDDQAYRKLYATRFASLTTDERLRAAREARAADELLALAFDPEPAVVRTVLSSGEVAIDHARLVAQHHRTASGLDAVAARAEWLRDRHVQRNLMRNPIATEALLKRILAGKRLADVYRSALDTDLPERSRLLARGAFRARFNATASEEKASLVFSTEGRVLALLVGLSFDARTTALLCSKTYTSILLVQNIARFPAAPPPLLAHLARQTLVKRQPHLRNTVMQHPNTPAEAKRHA